MKLINQRNIKFFQSDLLRKHKFNHAFFTKRQTKNEPMKLQDELNLTSNIHYLRQTHSNKIIQVNNSLNVKPKIGDCLITKETNQSLWIYTADCIPILIADTNTRNIAACHSGLKGLKKQILPKTIKRLENIGSKKDNLIFAIGPSISGDKYQVNIKDIDHLMVQIMGKSYLEKDLLTKEEKNQEEIILLKKDKNTDRILIDIKAVAVFQLYKEGIKRNQINLNKVCTFSNPRLFNSFRRNKSIFRQWSCIYS
tara:strand:+ start:1134 stop:1892 length:759 start_codon:yes stop_codon:yes gene_type:complete